MNEGSPPGRVWPNAYFTPESGKQVQLLTNGDLDLEWYSPTE